MSDESANPRGPQASGERRDPHTSHRKSYQTRAFFDEATWTLTYVVSDPDTGDAVVIDPVLDYDPLTSETSTHSADEVVDFLRDNGLTLRAVLETHAHADHLTAAPYLRERFGAPVAIGADIRIVQETFKRLFNLPEETPTDGSQFDRLLVDGEELSAGSVRVKALATPGHTPACLSYLIGDAVFTGDALFIEDYGTGRTDFPAGNAAALYRSVHDRLYELPPETRVFVGHDYKPGGREVRHQSSIGVERSENVQLSKDTSEREFVAFREERDASLAPPKLIYQSVQVNVFGGTLPKAADNGVRYLRIPLNLRHPTDEAGRPVRDAAAE